jgi:hypothetical protein
MIASESVVRRETTAQGKRCMVQNNVVCKLSYKHNTTR